MLIKNDVIFNDYGYAFKYFSTQSSVMGLHNYYELVYVVRGQVKLKCTAFTYDLSEGDIFMVNVKELHKFMTGSKDNRILILHFDPYVFQNLFPNLEKNLFVCNSNKNNADNDNLQSLKNAIVQLAKDTLEGQPSATLQNGIINIITILVEKFRDFSLSSGGYNSNSSASINEERLDRINDIQMYIYQHAGEKISLDSLSEKLHLNRYYVSHFIKQTIGLSMTDFLNLTRVELSEAMLINNEMSIEQISYECGFSARRYYEKHFKRWYGVSPSEYRNAYQQGPGEQCIYYPLNLLFSPDENEEEISIEYMGTLGSNLFAYKRPDYPKIRPKGNKITIESPFNYMSSITVDKIKETKHLFNIEEIEIKNIFKSPLNESTYHLLLQLFEDYLSCQIRINILIEMSELSNNESHDIIEFFKLISFKLDNSQLSLINVSLSISGASVHNLSVISRITNEMSKMIPNVTIVAD